MAQDENNLTAFIQRVDGFFHAVPNARMGETQFEVDFLELKILSNSLKQSSDEEYQSTAGMKAENRKKNRYKDITPFDATRVQLTTARDDDLNSDYINASFIKGADNDSNYIASQGPLPNTVLDFWQMLWQYNVGVIVMVCREVELGKKKCERYWAKEGETKTFGAITVTSESDENLNEGYSLRVIKAVNGQETRLIKQFHYTSWPDHGVPKTCYEIISLINHVREVQSYSEDVKRPLCVHCSAGCGRTGAVIVVDFVRNLLDQKCVPADLKTFDVISKMRRQRPAIVQTKEQYEFVNVAIAELFKVYISTKTLDRNGFLVGYQGEQYVNVNIKTEKKPREKNGPTRPPALQYENFELRPRSNGTTTPGSAESPDIPPPKPKRPVSSFIPMTGANPYANFSQKQVPPKPPTPMLKPVPTVRPKPAGNGVASSPVNTTATPDVIKPRPPVANKPIIKPTVPTLKPTDKFQGKTECTVSSLHGATATDLSSDNHTGFPLTKSKHNNNSNNSTEKHKRPHHITPKNLGIKSPVREKAMIFEVQDKSKQVTKTPRPKHDSDKLKIREENDLTSESEAESPLSKGNFDNIKAPPVIKPKPRLGVVSSKTTPLSTKEISVQDRKAMFEPERRTKLKPGIRPLSQSFPILSHSNEKPALSILPHHSTDIKAKPPPVAKKSAVVRSASVSRVNSPGRETKEVLIKREIGKAHDYRRQPSSNAQKSNKVQVVSKNVEGATIYYAAAGISRNVGSEPDHSVKTDLPKPYAAQNDKEGSGESKKLETLNPSYGLLNSKLEDGSNAQNNADSADLSRRYINTGFPGDSISTTPQSYENHVLPPSDNSLPVHPRSYANTLVLAPSQANESKLKDYVNDSATGQGHRNDLHGSVQTTSNKARRTVSSPLPPSIPAKTPEADMLLDNAPPALPERTADSYQVIQVNELETQAYETQAYETFDANAATKSSAESNEARRFSATTPSVSAGVKSKMANMFDKTTTALSKVGATISKTGDDTNAGPISSKLQDRKPSYAPEPVIYNGQDMSFGRRLMKKVRGPRKQK